MTPILIIAGIVAIVAILTVARSSSHTHSVAKVHTIPDNTLVEEAKAGIAHEAREAPKHRGHGCC